MPAALTAMIQIRNVPDALHPRLKSRAALAGMSLSDHLLSEIRRSAERPTIDELRERLARRPETTLSMEPAQAVRTPTRPPVLVVDASALLEALLRTPAAREVEKWLFEPGQTFHAPHLLDVEVARQTE